MARFHRPSRRHRPSSSSSTLSNISEAAGPIEAKFHVGPPCLGVWKIIRMVVITWPRWPPHPYMVKNNNKLSNVLLRNQKTDDLQTWCTASGTRALQSVGINDDPGLTLTFFAGDQICPLMHLYGKMLKQYILQKPLVSKFHVESLWVGGMK